MVEKFITHTYEQRITDKAPVLFIGLRIYIHCDRKIEYL